MKAVRIVKITWIEKVAWWKAASNRFQFNFTFLPKYEFMFAQISWSFSMTSWMLSIISELLRGIAMLGIVLTRAIFLSSLAGLFCADGSSIIHLWCGCKYLTFTIRFERQFILLNRFANDSQSLEQHRHVECKQKVESQQANLADDEGEPVEDRGGLRGINSNHVMQNGNFAAATNYNWKYKRNAAY